MEAFWRQVCYIRRKFATKKLVFLNLDETSIGYSLMPQAGCVTAEHGRQVPFTAKVKKENHRGCFTYVAIICTCTSLQGKLPHYLLGSRARLTKAVMRGQAALPQTNLKVLAQQSAWNSSPCMVQILEEVAAVIKSVCSAGTQGVAVRLCAMSFDAKCPEGSCSVWPATRVRASQCHACGSTLGRGSIQWLQEMASKRASLSAQHFS